MGEKILEFKRATAEDLEDYMKAKIDAFSDDLCTYGFGPTGYKKIGETELRENKNGFFLYEYENRGLAKAVFSECIKRGMSKGIKEFSISAREEKTRKLYSSFGKARAVKRDYRSYAYKICLFRW